MDKYDIALFEKGLKGLGISLRKEQIDQFLKYYEILIEWNKVMNLTAITDFNEVMVKHFLDSLAIVKIYDMNKVKEIIDIGTGAGFPGIPLKIAFPHIRIVLLDSLKKRLTFLDEVINEINLANISTIHGRAEDFANKQDYREQFDLCVSRAVARLNTLSEYCLPFVKVGGRFISYKAGGTITEEIEQAQKAFKVLGGEMVSSEVFSFLDTAIERSFIVVKKKTKTPKKYPRKAGLPAKEPID